MKIYFYGSRALVRVLATGRTVYCAETGEGWQLEGGCSLNRARHTARIIRRYFGCNTFYFMSGKK